VKRILAIALLGISTMANASDTKAGLQRIGEPMLNGTRLPFSSAVRAGDTVYLSGALGITPDGKLGDGFDAQVRLAMDNLGNALKQAGLGWGDVAKCTVMLDNMADWPAFNKVYVTYFPDGNYPARSAYGTDGLALGALVEVECIAYAPKR
jgi:reactive intermediate/imine deaminase